MLCHGHRFISDQENLFKLHASPQPFDKFIVTQYTLAIHADVDVTVIEHLGKRIIGILAALTRVEYCDCPFKISYDIEIQDTTVQLSAIVATMKNMPDAGPTIKKLLNMVGFELRRRRHTISDLKSFPKLATAGSTLEFIGTQGVGKTTLYNACWASIKDRWYLRNDLEGLGPSSVLSGSIERIHRDILFKRINFLNSSDLDPWQSVTYALHAATIVYESLMISTQDFPRGFALEEGLFKCFPEEVLNLCDAEAKPLWKKRAFVYLRARDTDIVLTRFQLRSDERRNREIFQHYRSDHEVRSRIDADNRLFDQILEKAKVFACPLIVINAEDRLQDAVKDVLEFERSLSF